ncbi:hypothetical protein EBZ80_21575 [bacterium]|nr:hypothetical protein [bacterium]
MTNKEWFARPDLIEGFAEILRADIVQLALGVVEDAGIPRSRLHPESSNLMENHALLNAKREGYFEAISNLRSLAVRRVKAPDLDLSPWKYASEQE